MKILFFGASNTGYNCCKTIIDNGFNVSHVITVPQEFEIKYKGQEKEKVKNYLFADFTDFQSDQTQVLLRENNWEEVELQLQNEVFDLMICIGWYHNIPESIINNSKKGLIGIHGSLLPKYRGNAPLVWAMINGEKKTGISLFYFNEIIDGGDIIDQVEIPIEKEDYIADILQKVEVASKDVLLKNLPLIAEGKENRVPQNHDEATYFPKRRPEDGEIDWSWDNEKIANFIKAQAPPYPGAFTIIKGKKVIIEKATILDSE